MEITATPEITGVETRLVTDLSVFVLLCRTVVEMTAATPLSSLVLDGPPRLVFDLCPAQVTPASGSVPSNGGVVERVRWASHPGRRVRVVLDLARAAHHRHYWLADPPRLVIEVDRTEVFLHHPRDRRLETLSLDDYLVGVLGAEMPAGFGLEALKAQAVLARTYALRRLRAFGGAGCSTDPRADLCSDPAHCQGFRSVDELRAAWKEDADRHLARLAGAVGETRGLVITYDGLTAEAVYHSTCGGRTASAREVWGAARPYLEGVMCGYCEISPHYRETRSIPLALITGELGVSFLTVSRTTPSGRAEEVTVGGKTISGRDLRRILGLPSTWLEEFDGEVRLTTRGAGHGVGLCQWGAEGQARLGRSFGDILLHYYPGVSLTAIGGAAPDAGPSPPPEPAPGEGSETSPGPGVALRPVVVLDPGHGGRDPGAVGPGGLTEKEVNLAIGRVAAASLGTEADVVLTRDDDRTVSLRERTDLAARRKATLFVSLHANGAVDARAHGTETFHYPGSVKGRGLAALIQSRVVNGLGRRDRGVKTADFFVLRETACPAALAEVLFITNPEEEALLRDPGFQLRAGIAVAAGIVDYLRG